MKRKLLYFLTLVLPFFVGSVGHIFPDFVHHSDVVRDVRKKFSEISTYKASFVIKIIENSRGGSKKEKTSSGLAYYKKGGKVNFSFSKPYGDKIISNGRKMWVYIQRLNAVGVQTLDRQNNNIYNTASYEGLVRLFQRYHYRFHTTKQPKNVLGGSHYVLALEEKVDSGGFSNITVYVNANSKLIRKMVAVSRSGRKVELDFKNIQLNIELPGSLFTYKVEGNVKVVENPLTIN